MLILCGCSENRNLEMNGYNVITKVNEIKNLKLEYVEVRVAALER